MSYAELKLLEFEYATFGEFFGEINLDRDILILHTPSGGGHYKLILVRRGRFESGGAAAATASKLDPIIRQQMMNFLKSKMEQKKFRKLERMANKKKNGNDIILYHAEVHGFYNQPNQFIRNANMTRQPKQEELTNANRTKMKNFFKSKIPNNNMKGDLNRSINMLEDEELLRQYLIEKESNKQIKQIIKTYNHKQLLQAFIHKQLDETGGASKGGSSFVYVSKIGRRKLRYTKTGRKFIINKGKRKYLK